MNKNKKSYKDIYGGITGKTLNIGLTIGVSIALCTFIGYEIDEYFHTSPNGIIGGSLFGILAGFVNMWEQLRKLNQKLNEDNNKRKDELPKA